MAVPAEAYGSYPGSILDLDAVRREKILNGMASTMGAVLIDAPSGMQKRELSEKVREQIPGFGDGLHFALSRLDILEEDDGTVRLFTPDPS